MGERENQQCHQKYDIPTKISKSLRTQQGECTILKHAVVKRPGQICISKKPVNKCPSWRATLLLSKPGFPNPGLAFSQPTNFKLNGTLITYLNSFNWLKILLK